MYSNDIVTVVNRSSKELGGTWNGRQFVIKPGKHSYPRVVAEALKRQNPIMGTMGHDIWDIQYLIGIEESGDDCSPVEQSTSKELYDKKVLHGNKEVMEVPGVTGLYGRGSVNDAPLPDVTVAGFEKP